MGESNAVLLKFHLRESRRTSLEIGQRSRQLCRTKVSVTLFKRSFLSAYAGQRVSHVEHPHHLYSLAGHTEIINEEMDNSSLATEPYRTPPRLVLPPGPGWVQSASGRHVRAQRRLSCAYKVATPPRCHLYPPYQGRVGPAVSGEIARLQQQLTSMRSEISRIATRVVNMERDVRHRE